MTSSTVLAAVAFVFGVVVGLSVLAIPFWRGGGSGGSVPSASSHALTIHEIRELSTLLTRRIEVADVCVTRIDGYLGGVEAALLVRGHVDLGVDLDAGNLEVVDPANRVATLRLPAPHVVTASLDHARTRIFTLSYAGVWRLNPQSAPARRVIEQGLASAQEQFAKAGQEPAHVEAARRHVEAVVPAWAHTLGWTVHVEWR